MRNVLGPTLGLLSLGGAMLVLGLPSGCVVECSKNEDCGLPYKVCNQHVCEQCRTKEDCHATGDPEPARDCWHGTCCVGTNRGCFAHDEKLGSECTTAKDCAILYGIDVEGKELNIPALPFCDHGTCHECRVDNDCQRIHVSDGKTSCVEGGKRLVCKEPEKDASPTGGGGAGGDSSGGAGG